MHVLFNCWSPRKGFTVAGFFLLLLTFSFSLNAELRWFSPPTPISSGGSIEPNVSINDAGQAVATWFQGGQVYVNRHTPSGGWTGAAQVSSSSQELASDSSLPKVVVNNSGQALVFRVSKNTTDNKYYLRFASMATWGSFSSPSDVPVAGAQADFFEFDFDLNNNGKAVAAWVEGTTGNLIIKGSAFTFTGGWSSPSVGLSDPFAGLPLPRVGMNDRGGAIVVWVTSALVKAANLSAAGSWITKKTIASEVANLLAVISINNNSNAEAVAAWTAVIGGTEVTRIARWTPAGWIAAESVFTPSAAGWTAQIQGVSINDAHQTAVTWINGDLSGNSYIRVGTNLFSGSAWTMKEVTGPLGSILEGAILFLDSEGQTVLVWSDDQEGQGNTLLRTSNTTFGGEWPAATTLSQSSDDVGSLSFVGSENGIVMAAFSDENSGKIKAVAGLYPPKPPGGNGGGGKGNVHGKQKKNKFLTQTEYYNHIEWNASPSHFVSYSIYANGKFVSSTAKTHYDHRGQKKNRPVVYSVSSTNPLGHESDTETGVVP